MRTSEVDQVVKHAFDSVDRKAIEAELKGTAHLTRTQLEALITREATKPTRAMSRHIRESVRA